MKNLVIVESPAKAKTIEKYLGAGFKVCASMGHLRDLPKSELGVDIENGFTPKYIPIQGKKELVKKLKESALESDKVYLATDPDREGEAISWHLKQLLDIDDDKAYRVTFNEITPTVVKREIENPRSIDQNLVDAQQARRILDRIVGYKLSPFLWKKVKKGLSAGRVQSVAVKIVVDREKEIEAFSPQEFWNITAVLKKDEQDQKSFSSRFYGDTKGKIEITNGDQTTQIVEKLEKAQYSVYSIKNSEKRRSPQPPFITSTLQQEASRRFGFAARRTMALAQELYEGVEVKGHGFVGLITYMRTDSVRISADAVEAAKSFVTSQFGKEYLPKTARKYKTSKSSQDAHEAIRPSVISLPPSAVEGSLNRDQSKIYRLIWERFLASQMADALYDAVNIEIEAAGYIFKASDMKMKFKGYTVIYDDSDAVEETERIPKLEQDEKLILEGLSSEQKFTQPPARYSEATLIKAMEENGIGRPSTYAPTITTIFQREYVEKEGKFLKPTPTGRVITELMEEHFKKVIDVDFTAKMENDLDLVEDGKIFWKDTLSDFYKDFASDLKNAETALDGKHVAIPHIETDEICEKCSKPMVIKSGRFGKFLACSGYPECKNTKPIITKTEGSCPLCGSAILEKKSRNGAKYFGCENNPKCPFMTWDIPTKENCTECGKTILRQARFGRKYCSNPDCVEYKPPIKKAKTEGESAKTVKKSAPAAKKAKVESGSAKTSKKSAPATKKAKTDAKKK